MVIDPISIAIQVALVVASIILTAKNVEVGKLDDINVDTGSYNRLIPRVYGTQLVVPQTIWIAGNKLVEIKKKKKILGGLGGSVTTYHYFATFALAATNNKVQIRRVWANDTLVYDGSSQENGGISDEIYDAFDGIGGGLFGFFSRKNIIFGWEFKDGDANQSVSSLIKAVDGETETPAYRGISMMVFRNFPLKDFGNSIPQFKFEVVEIDSVNNEAFIIPAPLGTFVGSPAPAGTLLPIMVDDFGRVLQTRSSSFSVIDPIKRTIETALTSDGSTGTFFGPGLGYDKSTNGIVFNSGVGSNPNLIDATTGAYLGFANGNVSPCEFSLSQNGEFWMCDIFGNVANFGISAMLLGTGAPVTYYSIPNGDPNFTELAPTGLAAAPRFGASYSTIAGQLLYIHGSPEINVTTLYGYGTRPGIGYSQIQNAFYLFGSAGITKIGLNGELLASNSRSCSINLMAARSLSTHDASTMWLAATDGNLIEINVSDLTIEKEYSPAEISGLSGASDVMPLAGSNAVLVLNSVWKAVFLDRVDQAGTTVQHIVEDLADQIGFPQARLDASAGTRSIGGMIVAGDDARRSIDELLKITGYDLIEEDGKVKVVDRGNAPVMAIDFDDLGTDENDGKPYRLERTLTREADAPWKVELGFSDIDGDFESNLAIARRAIDAVETQTVLAVDTPIALDVDTAKTFAGKMLSQAHRERAGVSLSLPMVKYGQLSPGDVISVPDGIDNLNVKIVRASGAHVLEIKGVIDDPTGIDTLLSGTPRGIPPASLAQIGVPRVVVVDSALPYDTIAMQDGYGLSASSVLPGKQIGVVDMIRSVDGGASYDFIDITDGEPNVGTTSAALADIPYPNMMDHGSSFSLNLSEPPVTATQQELLDDDTRNIVFVAANDDWEVVQFMNVANNGDGNYTLSGFYRGLRGTEHLISEHRVGDSVVFISDGYLRIGDLTHLNIDGKYAALRTEDDDPLVTDHTPLLRGLKPYSPVDLSIEQAGENNIVTWTRRTRIGGNALNGSDVPLSETNEEYEIDIVDNSNMVVATKTGITTNAFTYTGADQTTDLGGTGMAYTARVYQMSEDVGRGVPSQMFSQNAPINPIIFELSFPATTTLDDSSVHNHTISLLSGAAVANTQTWAGQLASVQCLGLNDGIQIPDAAQFIRGANTFTYECMAYITEDTADFLDIINHWLELIDRSLIIRRVPSKNWEVYSSENGTAFTTIASAATWPFTINQWTHIAVARHSNGNISIWQDGARALSASPTITSYYDTFNNSTAPVKFMTGTNVGGLKGYLGWAAMRRDDVYGDVSTITVPVQPYGPPKVKAIAVGMTGSGHNGATWSAIRYKETEFGAWVVPSGATLSADPNSGTYNGAISSPNLFLDQSYSSAGFTSPDAFVGGLIAKQIMTFTAPIDEPYEVSFIPYMAANGFSYMGVFIELIYEDNSVKVVISGQTTSSVAGDEDASDVSAIVT